MTKIIFSFTSDQGSLQLTSARLGKKLNFERVAMPEAVGAMADLMTKIRDRAALNVKDREAYTLLSNYRQFTATLLKPGEKDFILIISDSNNPIKIIRIPLRPETAVSFGKDLLEAQLKQSPSFVKSLLDFIACLFCCFCTRDRSKESNEKTPLNVPKPVQPALVRDHIIPQPPDGNCLFHALAKGLELLKQPPLDHRALRQKIVAWMGANIATDRELQEYIDFAIDDYMLDSRQKHVEEQENLQAMYEMGADIRFLLANLQRAKDQLNRFELLERPAKYQWYLNHMSQPKEFGTRAEIYTFSKLYPHVSIHTWRRLENGRYSDEFDTPFNNSKLAIHLAYNLAGNHFDNYIP